MSKKKISKEKTNVDAGVKIAIKEPEEEPEKLDKKHVPCDKCLGGYHYECEFGLTPARRCVCDGIHV